MNGYKEKNIERDKRDKFIFYEHTLTPILTIILIVFLVSSLVYVGCKLKKNKK
jgi:hypothetical protein